MHTGYEDAKAFRQVFRKIVGLSPKEYREKYAG
jgi:YesN/AraC family two-component response regulator